MASITPDWIISGRELWFSGKLLCLSSQVFSPGPRADLCSSFQTAPHDSFCVLQIHHLCSVFSSLGFCRQKEEISKSLPGSFLKSPNSAALPRSEIPWVLLCDTQHMQSGEDYKEERWDCLSNSSQKLVKGQNQINRIFLNIALQALKKPHFLIQGSETSSGSNLHYSSPSPTISWIPSVFTLTQRMPVWSCLVSHYYHRNPH